VVVTRVIGGVQLSIQPRLELREKLVSIISEATLNILKVYEPSIQHPSSFFVALKRIESKAMLVQSE
jgi:hypothetical protein